ncbi:MAG: hypothetical protein LLF94_00255 [Chlamydiales bacterium]|nr:hypothetical protein [Chlamydiales bacterium]
MLNILPTDQPIPFKDLPEGDQNAIRTKNQLYIGKQIEVVIDGYHTESRLLMRGRYDEVSVIINDGRKVTAFGKKYLVEITDVSDYDLIGRVI